MGLLGGGLVRLGRAGRRGGNDGDDARNFIANAVRVRFGIYDGRV